MKCYYPGMPRMALINAAHILGVMNPMTALRRLTLPLRQIVDAFLGTLIAEKLQHTFLRGSALVYEI